MIFETTIAKTGAGTQVALVALLSGAVAGDRESEVRLNVEEALTKVAQMPEGSVLVAKAAADLGRRRNVR